MNSKQKKAFIVYERYYDFENHRVVSGGVQTYVTNLIPILQENGYDCVVYQFEKGNQKREKALENCCVYSVPNSYVKGCYRSDLVLKELEKTADFNRDLLVFADHILTTENSFCHSLSIQHGIHWDISKKVSRPYWRMFLSKALFAYREHKRMKNVGHVVCVDYNFLNWYRTQVDVPASNFTVIPNFAEIAEKKEKPEGAVKIIFARRFVPHRGTRIFADAVNRLLAEYDNVEITVAGRGPDEEYLRAQLKPWQDRVVFTQYTSDQSLAIHASHHIAVVPTVGSEGTSLSLLEAMSAQCAVVCTDVGGMTNIVLNGYNGKMISAGSAEALHQALKSLLDDPQERERIAAKGYETVKAAFSKTCWENRWREVLHSLSI